MRSILRATLVFFIATTLSLAEVPNFMGLGDLPGSTFESIATAVSADGLTVVGYSRSTGVNPAGSDEAFRWNVQTGQMLGLGALGIPSDPFRFSRAAGVNADGSLIVGDSRFAFEQPFKWQNGVLSSGFIEESLASQMASNGNWAVTSSFGPYIQAYRAMPFNNNAIPEVAGANSTNSFRTNAVAISSDGSTVIGQSDVPPGFPLGTTQGYRWTQGGGTQSFGLNSQPTAVNGNGTLIVGSNQTGMFRWTPSTGIQPFVGGMAASAMSDDGSIMVRGGSIWDANNGIRSISSVMTMLGVDMTGWSSLDANDISPDGTVIVGSGIHNGQREAFRAYIPEPSSLIGLIVGLLSIRSRIARCNKA